MRAVDSISSHTEAVGFELERLRRVGDRGLELRGRWFGIRGRRFVRPTLTMRIDGQKHRLLADLEHKPWAAQEGEEWVALFSPAPPAGKSERIELSVAPDITIALSPVGTRGSSAKGNRPAHGASAPGRRAPRRTTQSDGAPMERERANARDRSRRAEDGGAEDAGAELAGIAAERDAPRAERDELRVERDALRAERDALRAERDELRVERDELRVERDALLVEREGMRRQHSRARKRVTELGRELKALEASANASLSEARNMLEAERAQTSRLRSATVAARRNLPARPARRAPVWAVRSVALAAVVAVPLAFAHTLHLL